jgi:hypothetical protein
VSLATLREAFEAILDAALRPLARERAGVTVAKAYLLKTAGPSAARSRSAWTACSSTRLARRRPT